MLLVVPTLVMPHVLIKNVLLLKLNVLFVPLVTNSLLLILALKNQPFSDVKLMMIQMLHYVKNVILIIPYQKTKKLVDVKPLIILKKLLMPPLKEPLLPFISNKNVLLVTQFVLQENNVKLKKMLVKMPQPQKLNVKMLH